MKIIDEFLNIEKQIHFNIKNTNQIYLFLNIYEKEICEFWQILKVNEKNIIKFFINEKKLIEKFNIKYLNLIMNANEYLLFIFSIFLVKSFTEFKNLITKDENFLNENIHFIFESDQLINNIFINFKNLIAWLELSYNINNISLKYIHNQSPKCRLGILNIFNLLNKENKISIKKSWHMNKSLNFYIYNIEIKNLNWANVYTEPFKIFKKDENHVWIYIDHYTNTFKLLKENIYSGAVFKIYENDLFLTNLVNCAAYIDINLLKIFLEKKMQKINIKEEKLNQYSATLIKEIKLSITKNNIYAHASLSRKLSECLDLIRIKNIINFADPNTLYFFPSSLCFRGRTYFSSDISFTYFKEFRYCLHQGPYENNFKIKFHPLNNKIEMILSKYTHLIDNMKNFNFKNKNNYIKYSIIWILISIADINKNKLGEKISLEKFITTGIEILENNTIFEDEYDYLKFESLKIILNEINNDVYIKRLISKDATASCFQHLIKILGPKNNDALKWCNLMSEDTWYDTYKFILNSWINIISEEINDNDKKIIYKYFTRKSIKKPSMTLQYGSKFKTCLTYFINNTSKIEAEDYEKCILLFKSFHSFINKDIGLLAINSNKIITELEKKKNKFILTDKSEVNLNYYKTIVKQIKYQKNNERFTKQELIISNIYDKRKKNTSIRANYIHALDAAVVRYVIRVSPILTVHDCFLIDYQSIIFLISLINDAMQKTFHDLELNKIFNNLEIFSIFIVL